MNIGCGPVLIEGMINADLYHPSAAVKLDAVTMDGIPDDSLEHIEAHQLLEHLEYAASKQALSAFRRCLADNGRLVISVPDMEAVFPFAVRHGQLPGMWHVLMQQIYGADGRGMQHRWGYSIRSLTDLLISEGYDVERVWENFPPRPTPAFTIIARKRPRGMVSLVMPVMDLGSETREATAHAIASITATTKGPYELIVVMNGRVKGNWQPLGASRLVLFEKRVSIAEAYNAGFKEARGDYFACCHNDVELPAGWETPMKSLVDAGRALAFPSVDESGSDCDRRGVPKTDAWLCPGCFFMMRAAVWRELGGYDEAFLEMHWEDTDLFYRARKRGIALERAPVTVIHRRGLTRSLLPDRGNDALLRNRWIWLAKHKEDIAQDGSISLPKLKEV